MNSAFYIFVIISALAHMSQQDELERPNDRMLVSRLTARRIPVAQYMTGNSNPLGAGLGYNPMGPMGSIGYSMPPMSYGMNSMYPYGQMTSMNGLSMGGMSPYGPVGGMGPMGMGQMGMGQMGMGQMGMGPINPMNTINPMGMGGIGGYGY